MSQRTLDPLYGHMKNRDSQFLLFCSKISRLHFRYDSKVIWDSIALEDFASQIFM